LRRPGFQPFSSEAQVRRFASRPTSFSGGCSQTPPPRILLSASSPAAGAVELDRARGQRSARMSPRVTPREQRNGRNKQVDFGEVANRWLEEARRERTSGRSSYAEFRSRGGAERVVVADPAQAFWKYMLAPPFGAGDPDLPGLEAARVLFDDKELRVLSKATNAAGGYLVPTDFDRMITTARRARNVIANLARELETDNGRPLPLGTANAHGTGSWVAENAAVSASDDTFGQVSLGAFKGSTKTIVSEELAEDAVDDFDQYLADELGQRLAALEETAFATGDGTGKPLGITTSGNGVTVVTAATGSSTGFKLADVRAAYDALPAAYRPNASWIMSASAFSSLAGLTDTAGGLVLPSLHAAEPTLFSRPVHVSADMPAAAANARSVVVGDISLGYAVRRVRGLGVQRQLELHSDNGQLGYRAFQRVDGRVVLADALRILANSAT
jgi:HK97 family phage major capsid protein